LSWKKGEMDMGPITKASPTGVKIGSLGFGYYVRLLLDPYFQMSGTDIFLLMVSFVQDFGNWH